MLSSLFIWLECKTSKSSSAKSDPVYWLARQFRSHASAKVGDSGRLSTRTNASSLRKDKGNRQDVETFLEVSSSCSLNDDAAASNVRLDDGLLISFAHILRTSTIVMSQDTEYWSRTSLPSDVRIEILEISTGITSLSIETIGKNGGDTPPECLAFRFRSCCEPERATLL